MKKILATLPFLLSFFTICGQPLWQQQVDYSMVAELDIEQNMLHARQTIKYTNNSPHTLHVIYMHLWPNAYSNKGTPLAKQLVENGKLDFQFAAEAEMGFIDSIDFRIGVEGGGGEKLEWQFVDEFGEIAEIKLPGPLEPGEEFIFSTPFRVKVPAVFSRMGFDGQTWQITQWYPKPAVFDESGWNTMPYLDQGEFYSEFGNFEVTIVVPQNLIVAASGELQTTEEREWLLGLAEKSANSFDSPDSYKPWPDGAKVGKKEITYSLENAHDFAWFASKDYMVQQKSFDIKGKGYEAWTFFHPNKVKNWRKALNHLERSVNFFSEKVGQYPYSTVTAVSGALEAGSGMEYPTITVISSDFELERILLHEVGHNWFYGILASNERLFPWMDEGFTSYYENLFFEEERNKEASFTQMVAGNKNGPFWMLSDPGLLSYIMLARQEKDQPINYHSAHYTWNNYGSVAYGKAGAAIKYLAHYLGVQEFDSIMRTYYQRYKFTHPQPKDIENIFVEMASKDVSWFFGPLINTVNKIDYGLRDVTTSGNSVTLAIQNITGFAAPLMIRLYSGEKVHKEFWVSGFAHDTIITVDVPELTQVAINPPDIVPEADFRNNFYIKGQSRFKATLGYAFERKGQRQMLFFPAAGYNIYDGFMLGAAFYSNLVIPQRMEYAIAPMFGFGSSTITGLGQVRMNFYGQGEELWSHFALGVEGRRFSYDKAILAGETREGALSYNKLSPFVNFSFKKLPLRNPHKHTFKLRSVIINEEAKGEYDTINNGYLRETNRYIVNEIGYNFTRASNLAPLDADVRLQHGPGFVKLFGEANFSRVYSKKGKQVDFRLYGGKFLHADNSLDNRFAFRLGAKRGHWDYMYDHLFFGRSNVANPPGIANNQIVAGDGNFKMTPNRGVSQNWLVGLNTEVELPWRLPICFYGSVATWGGIQQDLGLNNAGFLVYEGGAILKIMDDVFEIYFPAVYTPQLQDDITNIIGDRYFNRVTFMLNLRKLNPFELREKIKLF